MPPRMMDGIETPSDARNRVRVDGKFFSRSGRRFLIQGVTYGPFAPNAEDEPFPIRDRVREDFTQMRAVGINSIRTYCLPPEWLLTIADRHEISVLIDVPWSKHVCFLNTKEAKEEARRRVRQAAELGRRHPCVLAYSVCNEIPSDIVRWYGARRIEKFLAELVEVAKQSDPDGLVTYANYPTTEYLDLSFLDFITFNVYLHDVEAFSRYLLRLQNLVGDKPLVLGEIGMDTLRMDEMQQAEFLAGHVREATLIGLAGVFIFSWTDDWYTGGYQVEDWAFGITKADRTAKAACRLLGEVLGKSPAELLEETPRVSVVICSYNGGRTLEQCLQSLLALNYPNYEVILVDDGSTDSTREIASRFPRVRAIHLEFNQGLSVARNVGLKSASGSIIAYTDSDCFVDPNWLTHLVYQLQRTGAAAAGGPNLTPEDGWRASCIGVSPGQPTHVLESDQVAEHIPGCNMAFRREALEAINGFDPVYRKAGDDVDVCWRLQQAGFWITFAPGAFVWHHRRQTVRSYFRQQLGYGEAEALLQSKHPDKFNFRGNSKWRGVLYGVSLQGLRLVRPVIYRGIFGTGFFQCLYQPGPASWALLPGTLEWHGVALLLAISSLLWRPSWIIFLIMLFLSVGVATLQASQARLAPEHNDLKSRLLIAVLCYLQPLVRSWGRYRRLLLAYRAPVSSGFNVSRTMRMPVTGLHTVEYWTENWRDRTELLNEIVAYLNEHRLEKTIDSGWSDWDLEIYGHPWTSLQLRTVQENHGSGKGVIRVRYRLRLTKFAWAIGVLGSAAAAIIGHFSGLSGLVVVILLVSVLLAAWWHAIDLASDAIEVFDIIAREICLLQFQPSVKPTRKKQSPTEIREATDKPKQERCATMRAGEGIDV